MKLSSFKVGIGALLLLLLSYLAYQAAHRALVRSGGRVYFALFHDASGLFDRSKVQVAGLVVGEIVERRLQGSQARVSIRLRPEVELYSNAVAYKKTASLLGSYYLEIDPGSPQSPDPGTGQIASNRRLHEGERIAIVVEEAATSDLIRQLNESVPVVREVLREIQKSTGGPAQDLAREIQQGVARNSDAIGRMLANMDRVTQDVHGIVSGPEQQRIRDSIHSFREITDELHQAVGQGPGRSRDQGGLHAAGEAVRGGLDRLSSAIDSVNQGLGDAARSTAEVRRGEGPVGRLLKDDQLVRDVERVTGDGADLLHAFTQLRILMGLRTEYHILSADLKHVIELRLQPRLDRYYSFELVADPRPARSFTRTVVKTDDPSRPLTTVTDTTLSTTRLKISFQLAKKLFLDPRWLVLTLRYGIKESTAGMGADLDLFHDRLAVRTDLFDFHSNLWPRLRIFTTLQFWRNLYVLAGVDDVLNDRAPGGSADAANVGRDYFVGAQLLFNDEDLRTLLTFGGSTALGNLNR